MKAQNSPCLRRHMLAQTALQVLSFSHRSAIKPDKEWANFIGFVAPLSMNDERTSKQLIKELKTDINVKIRNQPEEVRGKELVEGDTEREEKIQKFFRSNSKWRPGEYTAVLKLQCEPEQASQVRKFRFTIFLGGTFRNSMNVPLGTKLEPGVYFKDTEQTGALPSY